MTQKLVKIFTSEEQLRHFGKLFLFALDEDFMSVEMQFQVKTLLDKLAGNFGKTADEIIDEIGEGK